MVDSFFFKQQQQQHTMDKLLEEAHSPSIKKFTLVYFIGRSWKTELLSFLFHFINFRRLLSTKIMFKMSDTGKCKLAIFQLFSHSIGMLFSHMLELLYLV